MLDLRIKLDEKEQARADSVLGELADRAENIEGGLRNVGEAILQVTDVLFETQTDPQGRPWAPLALTTIMLRGGSGHILQVSGRLRRSASYNVAGNVLRVGLNAPPYDTVHQFGSTHEINAKPGGALKVPVVGNAGFGFVLRASVIVSIPARPIIGFGPRHEEASRDAIEDWLAVDGLGE
ncbi:phage virion morphogenesis protein [Ancylobacter sp. A5.8]|uniref:phage virion morphogenesis protein n=1 Tax=Ancylobacter gelatini TaxID=2919920 RepID=UPI001F4D6C67|nr:phage virion morphogenesis protein [Ancylobacter gelatini]MCJ8142958.1 phage virion morphogenesis protein [Ancylobacter gelatini]